jgi:hypothetical protein
LKGYEGMEEIIKNTTEEKIEPEEKIMSVKVTKEMMLQLERIREFYRSPSIAHAVRLMIEDVDKGIEVGSFGK